MIKNELQVILDTIGGKSILGSLGCKIMLAEDTISVVLSDIKTSKKANYIKIVWVDTTQVELTFYKAKAFKFNKLQQTIVPLTSLRKEISDFLKIDI